MKTINKFIALTLTLCSLNGYSQILPVTSDSTGLILPPVESLEVIRQSVLNGGVQINNGLDLSGNALFRNNANVSGELEVLDLQVTRNIQFTGLVDDQTPVDQWLTIDQFGKVIPITANNLLERVYKGNVNCIHAEGLPNPAYWVNPVGTTYLITDECQTQTKVGINTEIPQAALDVAGSAIVSGNITVGNSISGITTLNNNQLDHNQNTFEINANTGQAVQFGKNANYNAVDVTITGNNNVLGNLSADNTITAKDLAVSENTTTKILAVTETTTTDNLQVNTDADISNNLTVAQTTTTAKLGIGTTAPKAHLQIGQGHTIYADNANTFIGRNVYWDNTTSSNKYQGLTGASRITMNNNKIGFTFYTDESQAAGTTATKSTTTFILTPDNKAGVNYNELTSSDPNKPKAAFNVRRIGTDTPYLLVEDEDYTNVFKIASDGTTYAQEIKIKLSSDFPDYVFAKDYQLTPLKEVASYINQNGHLPNIPSAEEVDKNGIGVGELQLKLLEKVEELTLYLLEQQKAMETQLQRIEKLEEENKQLRK